MVAINEFFRAAYGAENRRGRGGRCVEAIGANSIIYCGYPDASGFRGPAECGPVTRRYADCSIKMRPLLTGAADSIGGGLAKAIEEKWLSKAQDQSALSGHWL